MPLWLGQHPPPAPSAFPVSLERSRPCSRVWEERRQQLLVSPLATGKCPAPHRPRPQQAVGSSGGSSRVEGR